MSEITPLAHYRVEAEATGSFALIVTYKCGHTTRLHYFSEGAANADGACIKTDKCWACRTANPPTT